MSDAIDELPFVLHDFQASTVDGAIDGLMRGMSKGMYVLPTGTGKSYVQLALRQQLLELVDNESDDRFYKRPPIIITPRLEIIWGFLSKLQGLSVTNPKDVFDSEKHTLELAAKLGIFTPVKLRNILAKGELPYLPSCVIVDECHRSLAETYQLLDAYLNGVPWIGFTATPYRGNPAETKELHDIWGKPRIVLTVKRACERGFCEMPAAQQWAILNDDLISVQKGEFVIKTVEDENVFNDSVNHTVERIASFYNDRQWDRPTVIAVPTTKIVHQVCEAMHKRSMGAVAVTAETPYSMRMQAFKGTIERQFALVQIDVVSEGVDLPFRRLIDLRPSLSPRRWMQQIGRIMRPVPDGEQPPEYICVCRNLERFGYLMEGGFPQSKIKESQEAFGSPSFRSSTRAIGLEGLGKFVRSHVKLRSGVNVELINLVAVRDFNRVEYLAVVHPAYPEILYGYKVSAINPETNAIEWGKWRRLDNLPDNFLGFNSAKPKELTPKQRSFWQMMAPRMGLDESQTVDARRFQILPFLLETGLRLR